MTFKQRRILTPLLVLLLICLYISSRALSKLFEHRNFVARYQKEINHIAVAKVAPTLAYNIGRNINIHINYINKTENYL